MTTDEERTTWSEVLDLTDGRHNDGERWRLVMHRLACMYSTQKAALADATARAERATADRSKLLELIQADREAHAREGIRWEELLDEHAYLLRYAAGLAANLDAPATGEGE